MFMLLCCLLCKISKFNSVYIRSILDFICFSFQTIKVFHLSPDKAQLLVEELANQMGGSGETAFDIVNRLGGSSSQTSSGNSFKLTVSWHTLHVLLMGVGIIICYWSSFSQP